MKDHISHSEAVCYWDCQKKWYLRYIKGITKDNITTRFGSMAHAVLETRDIPDEVLYQDMKEAYSITSWRDYFTPILNTIDEYLGDKQVVDRELRIEGIVTGVIDLLCKDADGNYYIYDYKFTNNPKDYDDILLDEQLHLYAYLLSKKLWLPLNKINIGYISLPKTQFSKPQILRNGTLSKAKSQNTTYNLYLEAIKDLNLDEKDYDDILSQLKNKPVISTITTSPSEFMIEKCVDNLDKTIKDMRKGYVLENFSAYKCKNCEYRTECKIE